MIVQLIDLVLFVNVNLEEIGREARSFGFVVT